MDTTYDYMFPRPTLELGEAVLWRGKPRRAPFILQRTVGMLPLALAWLAFDYFIFFRSILSDPSQLTYLPFFLVHMFPVWWWIYNLFTAGAQWKKTVYFVTNRRVILQQGLLFHREKTLFFRDIRDVKLQIGLIDKLFGTGNIYLNPNQDSLPYTGNRRGTIPQGIYNVESPQQLFGRIQHALLETQEDFTGTYESYSDDSYTSDPPYNL